MSGDENEDDTRSEDQSDGPKAGDHRRDFFSDDNDSKRSRSGSRKKSKKKRRRSRSHSRSRSRSRSRGSTRAVDIQRVVALSVASALDPITKRLDQLTKESPPEPTSIDIQAIREKQQLLDIENKAATMKTAGAQSQYRCLAGIKRRISNSLVQIDELMLSLDTPEDPMYQQLSGIKEEMAKAEEDASDRISLLFKADEDPKVGWPALTILDKKRSMEKSNPETDKLFASCVKQVQEAKKPRLNEYQAGKRPFRPRPGWNPGASYNGWKGKEREREREREREKEREQA